MKTIINATAEAVWETISDFNALPDYAEAVVESKLQGNGVGSVRTFSLADGTVIVEKLLRLEEESRSLTYSIIESPLPINNYVATMELSDVGESICELHWYCEFDIKPGSTEEEGVETVKGVYTMGFEGLKKLHES